MGITGSPNLAALFQDLRPTGFANGAVKAALRE
jgi:hypothetical protein